MKRSAACAFSPFQCVILRFVTFFFSDHAPPPLPLPQTLLNWGQNRGISIKGI